MPLAGKLTGIIHRIGNLRKLVHIVECAVHISGHFSGWLVVIMVALVMFEVIMRYIVHQPPCIADEMSAYMLVALAFIGLAYCWKEKGHVRIEALVSRLPTKVSNWLRLVTLIIAFLLTIILNYGGYLFLARSFEVQKTSSSWLKVPLQGPHVTIVIGYTLLSLWLILEIVRAIMTIKSATGIERAEIGGKAR